MLLPSKPIPVKWWLEISNNNNNDKNNKNHNNIIINNDKDINNNDKNNDRNNKIFKNKKKLYHKCKDLQWLSLTIISVILSKIIIIRYSHTIARVLSFSAIT